MKQTTKLNEGSVIKLPEKYRKIEYEIGEKLAQWYRHIAYEYTKKTSFPEDTINYIIYAVLSDAVKGYQNVSLDTVTTDAKINEAKDMKQTIKLNESKLRQIIKESIKKVLKEDDCRYEETEEFANLEDEILQYISSEKYEQMCRNLTQKKANKMIEKHLSKMEEMLARGEGKDDVGDMTYDWLAFWYGVDNGTSKNGRVNLYVMEKNPSIQYQYSNEKYPNIPVEKARERITEVIKTYYEYAVKSAIPTIEQLKEILSIVKQYS